MLTRGARWWVVGGSWVGDGGWGEGSTGAKPSGFTLHRLHVAGDEASPGVTHSPQTNANGSAHMVADIQV